MTIHEFGQVHDEVVVLVHPSVVMWDYFDTKCLSPLRRATKALLLQSLMIRIV